MDRNTVSVGAFRHVCRCLVQAAAASAGAATTASESALATGSEPGKTPRETMLESVVQEQNELIKMLQMTIENLSQSQQ